MDSFGDHALACGPCGMYARHNRLRGAVAVESELAGLPPRLEVCLPGSLVRPADLLLVEPDDTLPTAMDPSVVHPLRLSSPFAEATPGSAAAMREVDKRSSNTAGCAAQGWRFIPVAAETTGGWGPEAQQFVWALIRKQSMRSGRPVREVAAEVWPRLSSAVAKGVAQMLLHAHGAPFATCAGGAASDRILVRVVGGPRVAGFY